MRLLITIRNDQAPQPPDREYGEMRGSWLVGGGEDEGCELRGRTPSVEAGSRASHARADGGQQGLQIGLEDLEPFQAVGAPLDARNRRREEKDAGLRRAAVVRTNRVSPPSERMRGG